MSNLDGTDDKIDEQVLDRLENADGSSWNSVVEEESSSYLQLSTSKKQNMQIHVQRREISSTTVQEGGSELKELDVEVYDQQTYEKEVFDQVNKAISTSGVFKNSDDSNNPEQSGKITDLIRLIHSQESKKLDETCDLDERDQQLLQLTRQERFKKKVKLEPVELVEAPNKYLRIPKIISSNSNIENPVTRLTKYVPSKTDDSILGATRPFKSRGNKLTTTNNQKSYTGEFELTDSELESQDEIDEDVDYETDSDKALSSDEITEDKLKKTKKIADDGDLKSYQKRLKTLSHARAKQRLENIEDGIEVKKLDEMFQVEDDLQIPKQLWDNLFEHQKHGVRWLWELHQLGTGGILGDEMGLGKTIQIIAFLTALKTSNITNAHKGYRSLGPVILVCPATVMHQWLLEFRKWWPHFRVAILHSTGNFSGERKNLVRIINKSGGVLIVSYPGVVIYQDQLHDFDWHYAILDEGHKIRNPDSQVTLACKRFRTPHRIILSGSPVQNNLKELWSIFDFIYPGKLGTLPVFMEQFAIPITQGGYANASDIQVQIAYKCSCVLRDTIKPFLLRRTKAEVNHKLKLPERSEQVLFCKLTDKQRKMYQMYLDSPTVRDIKRGLCQIFVGLTQLRKICNHPDLFDASECANQIKSAQQMHLKKHMEFFSEDETFGHHKKSGKMMVVDALLKLWKQQNHKVLLFTQSVRMLKIFIKYLEENSHKYLVMDGGTPIGSRQAMIEEFNSNAEIFIFLLTTRVGGVGINLTGANRIVIYDPDWNPSTDIQARERAWRIGQTRHVIIYRLLTAGTIEEKIYHRQVFKLYLTNRILKDAKQKRFFKTNDLHELFTLGDNDKNIETRALFDDDLQINLETIKKAKQKHKSKKRKDEQSKLEAKQLISEDKLKEMREQAKRLSQMISNQYGSQVIESFEDAKVKLEPEASQETSQNESLIKINELDGLEPSNTPSTSICTKQFIDNEDGKKKANRSSKKRHVEFLVKQDIYKSHNEESPDPRYKRDDYILERLFKSSNIFGALKHDKIETDSTSDFKVVESEAEKVARDAIRALRESRRHCLDSSAGVPNWTGRNGQVADRPRLAVKNKSIVTSSFTMNSSNSSKGGSLLDTIKKRNQINPVALARDTFQVPGSFDEEEKDKDFEGKAKDLGADNMASKIREFVLFRSAKSGEAQTEELLEFFKTNFTPDKTAIFKALLYKMCEFHRRSDKGFWTVKSEFR